MKLTKQQIIIISSAAGVILLLGIIFGIVIHNQNKQREALIREMEEMRTNTVSASTPSEETPDEDDWYQKDKQIVQKYTEQREASSMCDITGFSFNGDYYNFGDSMSRVYDNMMHRPIPVKNMFSSYTDISVFWPSDKNGDWEYYGPQYSVESLAAAPKTVKNIQCLSMYYTLTGNWKTQNRVDYTLEFCFVSSKNSYEKKLAILEVVYDQFDDAQEAIANFIDEHDFDGYTYKTLIQYMGESYEAHVQPDGSYFAFRDNKIILVNNSILQQYEDTVPPSKERTASPTDKLFYKGFWDIEAGWPFEDIYYAMQSRGWTLNSKSTWSLLDDQKNDDLMVLSFYKADGTYSNVSVNSILFYLYNNRLLFTYMPIDSSDDVDAIEDNCERRYVLTDYDDSTAPEAITWFFKELNYLPSWNPRIKAAKNSYYLAFKSDGMVSVNTDILDEYFREVCGINSSMNDM